MTEPLRRYGPLMRYIISPILTDERDRQSACLTRQCGLGMELRNLTLIREAFGHGCRQSRAILQLTVAAHQKTGESDISDNFPAPESGPEDKMLRLERAEALKKAMQTLSNADCALFYRKYYYMQSASQMAAELGMTERAVEGRLYRIKKKAEASTGRRVC